MIKRLKSPINVQLEITSSCNNLCQHCYNFWRTNKDKSEKLTVKNLESIMRKIIKAEIFSIVITGGEPLLNFPVVVKCLEIAKEFDIKVSLNSNLVCLTKKKALILKNLGLKGVLTSILGPNENIHDKITQRKNSFKKLIENINLVQGLGINLSANMVVSKLNIDYVRDTAKLIKTLNLKTFIATKVGCPGNTVDFSRIQLNNQQMTKYLNDLCWVNEELELKVDMLEPIPFCGLQEVNNLSHFIKRKCCAGTSTMTISYDGSVRPCSHIDISYGNLLNENFSEIWERMRCWSEGFQTPNECIDCSILDICLSGCRMEAKTNHGSINSLDPYSITENRIECANKIKEIKNKENISEVIDSNVFRLKRFKLRKENFGGVAYFSNSKTIILSNDGLKILIQLNEKGEYSIFDKKIDWGIIEPRDFVNELVRKKVAIFL